MFGNILAFVEFLKLMDILVIIESNAITFPTVTTGTARLLIVSLQALRDIVMDHETHIGFVDTHAESDSCHDDIDFLHQELVLVLLAGLAIQSRMVRQGAYAVDHKRLGQFLHFLPAQAINDARLARILLDIFDDILDDIFGLGAHLIVQVGAIK